MNMKTLATIIVFSTLGIAFSAQAHEPKEHMKDAEKPDCAAMKNMDHSKMDMNDPMMKQCMNDTHNNDSEKDQAQADHQDNEKSSGEQHSEHQH
jgi:hypothetical protein